MKHYITVTGTHFRYGTDFLKPGMQLRLVKETNNEYDNEAIRVEVDGIGKIGYVANSVKTVIGDTMSGGRLYDRIGDTARAKVEYIFPNGLVCKVQKKDILYLPACFEHEEKDVEVSEEDIDE